MLFHNTLDCSQLPEVKSTAPLQSDRLQPELGHVASALNMDVSRFVAITSVKVEPVGPNSENRWH